MARLFACLMLLCSTAFGDTVTALDASLSVSAGSNSSTLLASSYPFNATDSAVDAGSSATVRYNFTKPTVAQGRHLIFWEQVIAEGAAAGTHAVVSGQIDVTITESVEMQLYGIYVPNRGPNASVFAHVTFVKDPFGTPSTIADVTFSSGRNNARYMPSAVFDPGTYRMTYLFDTSNIDVGARVTSFGELKFTIVPLPAAVWAGLALLPLAIVKRRRIST